ncbi:MAG: STAS/SEC14 domain-containing protein [Sedimentitalea sp.]|nr:STAS/SEC14 domain-containing protein [Sedimentitalea sp.]
MIEVTPGRAEASIDVRMTGKLTAKDYEDVLAPALQAALETHDRVKVLVQIGPGFDGFEAGALWSDAKLGLSHWRGFDRVAVVTDVDWIEHTMKIFGFAMPCPVRVFDLDEVDEARRWLGESLGSIHLAEAGGDVLQVQMIGKLDSAAYARAEERLDAFIRDHDSLKLLLDLREFDGWQGLSALGDHFSLVREHYRIPSKVAVVGDAAWQKLAERILSRFVKAETRYFDEDDFADATAWIT